MTLLLLTVALCIVLSALASGVETGLYTIHPLRVRLRAESGDRSNRILQHLFLDPVRVVVTVLVVNNIVAMGASYASQALTHRLDVGSEELISLLVLTPVLFVLGEALPKNLFRVEADAIVPRLAWVLAGLIAILRPATWCIDQLMRFAFGAGGALRRADVYTRPGLTDALSGPVAEDILSATQRSLAGNVVNAATGALAHALHPMASVPRLDLDADRAAVADAARTTGARRFLAIGRDGQVAGMLHLYDVLLHPDSRVRVRDCVRPVSRLGEGDSILSALGRLREDHSQMAVVLDRQDREIGVVTLRDLLDEIVGESRRW